MYVPIASLLPAFDSIGHSPRFWMLCFHNDGENQVQWGRSDEELYFNEILRDANGENPVIKGVRLNMFTGHRKSVDCGIYALSPDGTEFAFCRHLIFFP
jgi:hypothetical protein